MANNECIRKDRVPCDTINIARAMRRLLLSAFMSGCLFLGVPAHGQAPGLPFEHDGFLSDAPDPIEVFAYISHLGEQIERDPENHEHYEFLAGAYEYLRLFEKARQAQMLALRYYPVGAPGRDILLADLARFYFYQDNLEEANQVLDQAMAIAPENPTLLDYRVYYYTQAGEYESAAGVLQRLQQADKAGDAYYNFYLRAREQGVSPDDMEVLLRACADQSPDNPRVLRSLAIAIRDGDVLRGKRNFPETIRLLGKARRIEPHFAPTYISLADTYRVMADTAGGKLRRHYARIALRWLKRAQAFEPADLRIGILKGELFLATEEYEKAIDRFETLYEREVLRERVAPLLALAYERKAHRYYTRGRHLRRALLLVQTAARLNPQDPTVLRTQAGILLKLREYDAAQNAAREGLGLNPREPELAAELETIKHNAQRDALR